VFFGRVAADEMDSFREKVYASSKLGGFPDPSVRL